jgi:hypothetical protein
MNIIYHHLGLGDHIICNGLVRKLIKDEKKYSLFCKKHNVISVSYMYRDIKNLSILPIDSDNDVLDYKHEDIIYIGHQNLHEIMLKHRCQWDEAFYKQVNIDFKERWDSFYYERNLINEKKLYDRLNPDNEKFVLIHNTDSTGTDRINYDLIPKEYKLIFVEKVDNIFDYGFLIATAKEIHCIDSSFKHLVDSIPTIGKLYYHKNFNNRTNLEHNHKKKWTII